MQDSILPNPLVHTMFSLISLANCPLSKLCYREIIWHIEASNDDDFLQLKTSELYRVHGLESWTLDRPSNCGLVLYWADPASSRPKPTLEEHLGWWCWIGFLALVYFDTIGREGLGLNSVVLSISRQG